MVQGPRGRDQKRRNQPDEQDGEHRDQCTGAGAAQYGPGLAAGTEMREPQGNGVGSGTLSLTSSEQLEYRMRVSPGVLQARLGA